MKDQKQVLTKHHRKCRSNGGSDERKNISIVPEKQHQSWHTLFFNLNPEEISQVINKVWLDPAYYFECRKRTKKT
jgi:hypothetical protein